MQTCLIEVYLHSGNFDRIRAKFDQLILTVTDLIERTVISKLEDIKAFLQLWYPELKFQLSIAESFHDVMDLIQKKCTLINISCLEGVSKHCRIQEAKFHIDAYKSEVKMFCKEVLLSGCDKSFMTGQPSLLKCQTIELVLEWNTDEHTLSEIEDLLQIGFGNEAERVLVQEILQKDNSVLVTCYAPQHIQEVLKKRIEKNLAQVKRMGLGRLTIGHNAAWTEHTRDKVIKIQLLYYTSVDV